MLRWLISAIGFAALKGEVAAVVRRASRRALLMALAVVLWLAAIGFAVAALTVWLADQLGGTAACAIVAGGLAVIGIAIQIGLTLSARKKDRADIKMPLAGLAAGSAMPDLGGLAPLAVVGIAAFLLGRFLVRR